MHVKHLTALLILAFLISSTASATNFSVGIDHHFGEINILGSKTKPKSNSFRFGYDYSRQLSIEFQTGNSHKEDKIFGSPIAIEEYNSLYFRFISNKYEGVTMSVDLGYSETFINVEDTNYFDYSGTEKYTGFSYRIVSEQDLKTFQNTKIRIAYESLYDDDEIHIRGYSLGFSYHF